MLPALALSLLLASPVDAPSEIPVKERGDLELHFTARPMLGLGDDPSPRNVVAFEAAVIIRAATVGVELRLLPLAFRSGRLSPEVSGGFAIALFQALGGEMGPALGFEGGPALGWSYRIGKASGLRLELLTSAVVGEHLKWGGLDVSVRGPLSEEASLVVRAGGGPAYFIGEVGLRLQAGSGVYFVPTLGVLQLAGSGEVCTGDLCRVGSDLVGPQLGLGVEWLP